MITHEHDPDAASVIFLESIGAARIDLASEQARRHNLRAVPRVAIELDVATANGVSVAGQRFTHGTSRAEVYIDALPGIVDRIRTDAHREAWAAAERACANATDEWKQEHKKQIDAARQHGGEKAAEAFIARECNLRPPHFLGLVSGIRHGIPPIISAAVLHPEKRDANGEPARVDLRAFLALDAKDREAWCLPAYRTAASAAEQANRHLADTIAAALERAAEGKRK